MDQALFILRLYQESCQDFPSVKPLSAPARGIEEIAVVSVREAWPRNDHLSLTEGSAEYSNASPRSFYESRRRAPSERIAFVC